VCLGSHQDIPAVYRLLRLRVGRQIGPAVNLEASTGMPASVSSRPDRTDSQSPAYTYLKQHLFATPANLQSEVLALQEAFPRGKNVSFTET
jgi:hypothetical protein